MRVAILGIKTLPAFAGADRVVERLVEHLPQHDITIYLAGDAPSRLQCTEKRHYVYVPVLHGKHLRAFSFFFLSALHYVVKGRADVVHVHNSDFGLFCPILKLRRARIVGTFHSRPYLRDKWGQGAKAFLRLSEWVFVRSCDVLTSVGPIEIEGRAVSVIPNGVDAPPASGEAGFDYDDLRLVKGRYLLFACGRLDATKGLHHLLEAYASLDDERPLLVIGDFTHDVGYARTIEERAGRDPRVVLFPRLLDRSTLYEVIQNSAAFVFPSEYEAMSMVLLEAIACRKIVACSDIPENVVIVGDDYPFLFRSGDPRSLADVLARMPDGDDVVRARFEEIAARYRWDEIAAAYDRIYRELAS